MGGGAEGRKTPYLPTLGGACQHRGNPYLPTPATLTYHKRKVCRRFGDRLTFSLPGSGVRLALGRLGGRFGDRLMVSGWVGGWVGGCSCRRGQTSRPLSSCGGGWWSDFSRRASAERATPLLDTPRPAASQPQLHVPLRAAGAPKTPAPLAATRALRRAAAAARAQPLALRATPQLRAALDKFAKTFA